MTLPTDALYYECHITIQPVFNTNLEILKEVLAPKFKFKVANLILKKEAKGQETQSQDDTFLTAHSKNFEDLKVRMQGMLQLLNEYKYTLMRYKIESVLLDSKIEGDFLEEIKKHEEVIPEEKIEYCCDPAEGYCCRHGSRDLRYEESCGCYQRAIEKPAVS